MNLHPRGEGGNLSPLPILRFKQNGHKMVGFVMHLLPIGSDLESGTSRYLGGACKLGFQLKQQAAPPPGLEERPVHAAQLPPNGSEQLLLHPMRERYQRSDARDSFSGAIA